MTKSSLYLSSGDEIAMAVDPFEDIFSFITDVSFAFPERPFFLAANPNTPASRVVTALDRLAEANVQRVVFSAGSVYRGVLFELVEGDAEE